MNVACALLAVLSLLWHTGDSRCSPTSYYKNCWIRRFPGIFLDLEESERRGAQLLRFYQEETALQCSRSCCLTRNFSCNLAIFHYDTTQENCFHLQCPTLESCILSHRGNVVLYNITKGVDPDLLVFGKHFTSNVRVLPFHYSRVNTSEQLPSDKRHFIHPPPPAAPPLAPESSALTSAAPQSTSEPAAVHTSSPPTDPPAVTSPSLSSTGPPSPTTSGPISTHSTPASPSTNTTIFPQSAGSAAASMSPDLSSKQNATDTEGSSGGNQSAGSEGQQDTVGGAGWHQAAQTLLLAVGVGISVLLSCCCSVMLVVSWRGQRQRTGHYRTAWRGRGGSMRLIKYTLVRESA